MIDRDKTYLLKELTRTIDESDSTAAFCMCQRWILKSALSLLKEQEATEPKQVDLYGDEEWWGPVCVCPYCKEKWMSNEQGTHFCPNCGMAVKWK